MTKRDGVSPELNAVERALLFAAKAHAGQVRKYTGEPYVFHCVEVASIVATVPHTSEMLCAALLHDTVEDTPTTLADIAAEFGDEVAALVEMVTDVSRPEDGNRPKRKQIDRDHLFRASPEGQTIKLADLISNTGSIVARDPGFAKVYLREKAECLNVLQRGDQTLHARAVALLPAPLRLLLSDGLPTPWNSRSTAALK